MKTGELYLEPTLIGFAALAALAAGIGGEFEAFVLAADISKVVPLAIGAYFLGILFDRMADTILYRYEHLHRLLFSEKYRVKDGRPFSEDRHQAALLAKGGETAAFARYLRSRIRLARAMVVLAPALGFALALRLGDARPWLRVTTGVVLLICYAVAFLWKLNEAPDPPDPADDAGRIREYIGATRGPLARVVFSFDERSFLFVALSIVTAIVFVAGSMEPRRVPAPWTIGAGALIGALQFAVGALAFYVWWRVSETYMKILRKTEVRDAVSV